MHLHIGFAADLDFARHQVAWGYSVVVKETFDLDFLSHVYPADEFSSPPINTQRLAVVFFVLSLGSLFDLNLVPCKIPLRFPDAACVAL